MKDAGRCVEKITSGTRKRKRERERETWRTLLALHQTSPGWMLIKWQDWPGPPAQLITASYWRRGLNTWCVCVNPNRRLMRAVRISNCTTSPWWTSLHRVWAKSRPLSPSLNTPTQDRWDCHTHTHQHKTGETATHTHDRWDCNTDSHTHTQGTAKLYYKCERMKFFKRLPISVLCWTLHSDWSEGDSFSRTALTVI